jgi:DNA-directed RNA polymerase subunit N (RpoN/RPB10)
MMPVRCFTCGKVIGGLETKYDRCLAAGMTIPEALAAIGARRSCCRTRFLTRADDCTDVRAIDGEFVRGIASVNRTCTKKRWVVAR